MTSRCPFFLFMLPICLLSLSGCPTTQPGKDTDTADTDDTNDDTDSTDDATIQQVQQGEVAVDSQVVLKDLVVTSQSTRDGEGFFVQEPGGGEWGGVYVFSRSGTKGLSLDIGDLVDITATVNEYYDYTELAISSLNDVSAHGIGQTVTADTLASTGPGDWEPWEGCLVTLPDQTATSDVNEYGEVDLASGIPVDALFYEFELANGAHCDSITGLIEYSFKEYKIAPRSAADLVNCTGGIPPQTTTIGEIQTDPKLVDATVTLEGVVATSGLTADGEGFFVQTPGGGEWNGLYVFLTVDASSIGIEPGMVLDLTGQVNEFYDFTELKITSLDKIIDTGNTQAPVVSSFTGADFEPYESVLSRFTDVSVTSDINKYGEVTLDAGLSMDNLFYEFDVTDGDSFSSITGLIAYSYKEYKVNPRDASDLVE